MAERNTIGQAFGALLGVITGTCVQSERLVGTVGKGITSLDNIMDVAVNKTENYKVMSLKEDEANLQMMQQALFESNPELFPDDFQGYKIGVPKQEQLEEVEAPRNRRVKPKAESGHDDGYGLG